MASGLCAGSIYIESGDAGALPNTAQTAFGIGPLDEILGAFYAGGPDVDMYRLHFNSGSASAWIEFPVQAQSASQDIRLFLFDSAGHGIVGTALGNGGFLSYSPIPSGDYFLALVQRSLEPYGPKDEFGGDFPIFLNLLAGSSYLGPNGPAGADPVANWGGAYPGLSGQYAVHLSGATFFESVPEPTSLLLVLLGVTTLLGLGIVGKPTPWPRQSPRKEAIFPTIQYAADN